MRITFVAIISLCLGACFEPPPSELAVAGRELGSVKPSMCPLPSSAVRNDAGRAVPPSATLATARGETYTVRWPTSWDCTTPGRSCTMDVRAGGVAVARVVLAINAWGRYRLAVTAYQDLATVSFPVVNESSIVLGSSTSDDRVFYPRFGGVVARREPATGLTIPAQDHANKEAMRYPGGTFAPLVIVGDATSALLLAAANASPQTLVPTHIAGGGARLEYYGDALPAGRSREYHTLFGFVRADADRPAWQVALDSYRCVLDTWQPTPTYSDEMRSSPGFVLSGLQDYVTLACAGSCPACYDNDYYTDASAAQPAIGDWVDGMGWIQLWGQFAPYYQCCNEAVESCGCCAQNVYWEGQPPPEMDERYTSGLDERTNLRLWATGGASPRIGYYARPPNVYPVASDLGDPTKAQYLLDWNAQNQLDGADAFYVDIVGRGYSGPPTVVASLLADARFSADTVIEGFVDVFPSAGFLQGYLDYLGRGGGPVDFYSGGPGEESSDACQRCLFVPMVRYLMRDRIGFLVAAPGPESFWQDDGDGYADVDCDDADWGTRQAFLLGLKLGYVPRAAEVYAESTIKQVNDLRASFWPLRPAYLHRYRLSTPAGVDARTFRMSDGTHRVAVENCAGATRSITFSGTTRSVPPGLSLQPFPAL